LRKNRLLGPIDLAYLAAHRRYTLGAQRQATLLAQKMSLLQRQIDDARAALIEAAKQRKMMEKLAERQKQRWIDDQTRRELAELDDVTQRMFKS
jgi:flagellar protein FliJ